MVPVAWQLQGKGLDLNRTRTLLAALAFALPVSALAVGCGGDDGDDTGDDPAALLDAAFNNDTKIESGVLDVSVGIDAEGDQGGSFTAAISGPFAMDAEDSESVGQFDFDVSVQAEGAAAEGFPGFEGGVTATEDNLYLNYDGTDYELGEEMFAQLQDDAAATAGDTGGDAASTFREGCVQAIEAQGGDGAACDFDVTAWFTSLENEGTEDKGGSETTHISGAIDVEQMLGDLVGLGTSVPGATGGLDPAIIESQLGTLTDAISEASFDVYPATEDDTLRGLDFSLGIDPSAIPGGTSAGVDSASIAFSFEISDVGSEQSFEAPADPQPIEGLAEQFGASIPGLGATGALPGSGSGSGSGPATTIDPDCIAEAQTSAEIEKCLE